METTTPVSAINTPPILDVINKESFLSEQESNALYDYLINHCDFQQKNVINDNVVTTVPRLIKWYGIYDYFYSGIKHEA